MSSPQQEQKAAAKLREIADERTREVTNEVADDIEESEGAAKDAKLDILQGATMIADSMADLRESLDGTHISEAERMNHAAWLHRTFDHYDLESALEDSGPTVGLLLALLPSYGDLIVQAVGEPVKKRVQAMIEAKLQSDE